jgi:predicted nucleotidyltransferase
VLSPPPTTAIELPREVIEAFCRRWQIAELAVFGSILRDDFGPESDVDFLVAFDPAATWSLMDRVSMKDELEDRLGRKVDLVSKRGIERSRNWMRREEILGTARPIYVSSSR